MRMSAGTLLSQVQNLANMVGGNIGANSAGEIFLLQNPQLITYASRSSVVQRDTLDPSQYVSADIGRELLPRIRKVRGEGFTWDGVSPEPTPLLSDAPQVFGQGQSDSKLASQVVVDQATLNARTGNEYARANNPYPNLTVSGLRNRDVYEPAEMAFVTLGVTAALSSDGAAFSRRCIPLSVTKRHNPDR